jgi:hypothetical protein
MATEHSHEKEADQKGDHEERHAYGKHRPYAGSGWPGLFGEGTIRLRLRRSHVLLLQPPGSILRLVNRRRGVVRS